MAMKELVEPGCGGANPLMKFVSHVNQDKALGQEAFHHPNHHGNIQGQRPLHETSDQELVAEYFQDYRHNYGAPSTFHMDSLLHEITHVQNPALATLPHSGLPAHDHIWEKEYFSTAQDPGAWIDEFNQDLRQQGFVEPLRGPVIAPNKWASEYLENLPFDESTSKDLSQTTTSLLECADDPRFSESKFFKFIKKLNSGEYIIEGNKVLDAESGEEVKQDGESERWVDEYEATISSDASKWVDEYDKELTEGGAYGDTSGDQAVGADGDFWGKLEEEWYNLAKDNIDEHPWLAEYTGGKDYVFDKENPMKEVRNAFEEGLKKLKEGDIISAILLFEAEVQQSPEHAEAWQYLGTSQSENEQDNLAIPALKKCLEIQPENLTALMSLAVCYTNESLQSQACHTLKQWLSQNPRYQSLLLNESPSNMADSKKPLRTSLMSNSMYNEIRELYIRAAQMAPQSNIDAEVQIGLGVLFNLSGEYDKAVDCFQAALHTNPNDALIWNKLGATLANGGRSEEAVEAYRHALQLSPGYVRARYNLGISCVNLKVFREAVEHFLTSLNIQKQGVRSGRDNATTMSESIWTTLRMALSLMGRPELHDAVDNRDLNFLNETFHIIEQPAS